MGLQRRGFGTQHRRPRVVIFIRPDVHPAADNARKAPLIHLGSLCAVSRIDRRTPTVQRVRERRAAVVLQRAQLQLPAAQVKQVVWSRRNGGICVADQIEAAGADEAGFLVKQIKADAVSRYDAVLQLRPPQTVEDARSVLLWSFTGSIGRDGAVIHRRASAVVKKTPSRGSTFAPRSGATLGRVPADGACLQRERPALTGDAPAPAGAARAACAAAARRRIATDGAVNQVHGAKTRDAPTLTRPAGGPAGGAARRHVVADRAVDHLQQSPLLMDG